MTPIIGLGAGGHAQVLAEVIQICGTYKLAGFLTPDRSKWGQLLSGAPVLGDDGRLPELYAQGMRHVFIGVGSVGHTTARQKAYATACDREFEIAAIIHPHAIIAPSVIMGDGLVAMAGAIVNTGVSLGHNILINTGAIVEHHCIIGDHTHIASGANIGGDVNIGEGAHIGLGASIRQGIRIGNQAVVGAGAVVIRDVPDRTTVAGVPAKELKKANHHD